MGPNAAWMRTHQECTFEWIDKRLIPGGGTATRLRPSEVDASGRHVFASINGNYYSFASVGYVDQWLRHDCVFKRPLGSQPGILRVGDNLAAFDDATVGRPRPGAPICGVVVGRDGPHVVVACRGSKLSFVVAAGLSVEGLPQIEKPRRSYCTAEEIERILPMNESLAKAGLLAGVPKDPRNIPGTLDYFMNHGCDPAALPAKVSPETALDLIAERMGLRRLPAMPTIHGPLTEAEIYAAQLANDAEREAPAPFPEWSRAPRSQSQAIGAGLGVWGTREPPAQREAKPYQHVSDEDLLPDA